MFKLMSQIIECDTGIIHPPFEYDSSRAIDRKTARKWLMQERIEWNQTRGIMPYIIDKDRIICMQGDAWIKHIWVEKV